ncbi:META domain-containing protein [Chloroflexota bacterium]
MFKSKLYPVLLMVSIVTLLIAGCAQTPPASEPAPTSDLEDVTWILESYGEPGDLKAVLEGTEITALFDSTEGHVRGSAGANSYSGGYQINENELSIQQIASTEMFRLDPEGVMDQEYQYLKELQSAESYEIQDGRLQINCGEQILIYRIGD